MNDFNRIHPQQQLRKTEGAQEEGRSLITIVVVLLPLLVLLLLFLRFKGVTLPPAYQLGTHNHYLICQI